MTYFATSCDQSLYPFAFCLLGIFIFSAQLFDICLYSKDYMINWEKLPPVHIHKIWYNKELFKRQSKILFFSNLIFGTLSLITITVGFTMINKHSASCLICFRGNLWIEKNLWGTLFTMLH